MLPAGQMPLPQALQLVTVNLTAAEQLFLLGCRACGYEQHQLSYNHACGLR
jgi:hypothetical protein